MRNPSYDYSYIKILVKYVLKFNLEQNENLGKGVLENFQQTFQVDSLDLPVPRSIPFPCAGAPLPHHSFLETF